MTLGTKSVLFGAHCFLIHPFAVAAGWWKLNGFPWDPRLWFAFFLHDIGYIGKPNMDGPEGERHPEIGARIMGCLFDRACTGCVNGMWCARMSDCTRTTYWHDLSLYHSRYYAKRAGVAPSKLCFADKLAFCYTPRWLYMPMVMATGEINEYLKNAQKADNQHWKPTNFDANLWHSQLSKYMREWVAKHVSGEVDTWTDGKRNANTAGVWR